MPIDEKKIAPLQLRICRNPVIVDVSKILANVLWFGRQAGDIHHIQNHTDQNDVR